jgi:hypothetical protein
MKQFDIRNLCWFGMQSGFGSQALGVIANRDEKLTIRTDPALANKENCRGRLE